MGAEDGTCAGSCVPALDVPQDSRQGMATLFSSQVFICRREGVFDLGDGKSCCCWIPLETAALAVALKVEGRAQQPGHGAQVI